MSGSDRTSRRVNFRDSPPSSGASSHYTSDSGVGSLSDHSGRLPNPERDFVSQDSRSQWNDLGALQDAYRAVFASKEHWKSKAKDLDDDASLSRKSLKEVEAKWRAIVDRNEQLEEEKKKVFKEKKSLADQVENMHNEIVDLRQKLAKANARILELQRNSPPVMSGANDAAESKSSSSSKSKAAPTSASASASAPTTTSAPAPAPTAAPAPRSSGKRDNNPRDHMKEQKRRLSQRFEPKDGDSAKSESTSSSTSSKPPPPRVRRSSYVEPFGPGPNLPRTVPPSPTRPAPHYTTNTFSPTSPYPPNYGQTRDPPPFEKVPRSIHPQVLVDDPVADDTYQEDGSYFPYPLPPKEAPHRSKRS